MLRTDKEILMADILATNFFTEEENDYLVGLIEKDIENDAT